MSYKTWIAAVVGMVMTVPLVAVAELTDRDEQLLARFERQHAERVQDAAEAYRRAVEQANTQLERQYNSLIRRADAQRAEALTARLERQLQNSNAAPNDGQELLVQAIGPALVTAYGQPVPSARLAEQEYVLLYFSAGWCGPCREFTPNLVDFYSEHRDAGFEVVLVSSDQSPKAMLAYMREAQMPFTAVPYERVEGSQLKARYGRSGIPHLVVVDRQGEVVIGSVGDEPRVSASQVLQKFRELIEAEVGDVAEPDEPDEELQVRAQRQWNTTDGRYSVVASLVSVADGIVRLRLEEGQTVNVPLERLSQEDRQYVRQYLARAEGN